MVHHYRADPPLGSFEANSERFRYLDLAALMTGGRESLARLPFCLRIVLENALRQALMQPHAGRDPGIEALLEAAPRRTDSGALGEPVALRVTRVLLPDSSGIPALIDLAALRAAVVADGGDHRRVEPVVPVELVVDHSLIVERHGRPDAIGFNVGQEFKRNAERYRFLRWAAQAFERVEVVPPGMGIVHQVHLERLARVIDSSDTAWGRLLHPEFVLGGDSHTPMINGLGVLGWGVGGVEAEAAMLGQPVLLPLPAVVGVRLTGALAPGATATDLVLAVTQRLRQHGVVGRFVEFFGDGIDALPVADRATVANMAPEYGATAAYFPIDDQTLVYLRQTGREEHWIALIERYARRAGFFRTADAPEPDFDERIEIDLARVEPSVAGPRRPQDRLGLAQVAADFHARLLASRESGGYQLPVQETTARLAVAIDGEAVELRQGSIVIAAITACTNTSNPRVMLAAGLLARNAMRRGLKPPAYVKTSMAPGSRVVTRYLAQTGLLAGLEELGFHVVGYGCTTCSGKSGPLVPGVGDAVDAESLIAVAVTSSNRNFEGRIHKQVRAAYLMSPPLVVAYALAGRIDIDLTAQPLGRDARGESVYLRDLWPDSAELEALDRATHEPALFRDNYAALFEGTDEWQALTVAEGALFAWDPDSTYILEPPFLAQVAQQPPLADALLGARALALFGDQLNTDHISPAGEILPDSDAGQYLASRGVPQHAFNAFTMRRGNHHVMLRGTFAHPRIQNLLVPSTPGGFTRLAPDGEHLRIHEAATRLRRAGHPAIVLAGAEYGMGSSRDWAAKGPYLLGVRAVLARSFERIHRANLVALGILPLRFRADDSVKSLGLTGFETFDFSGIERALVDGSPVHAQARADDGQIIRFEMTLDCQAPAEAATLRQGGMFRQFLAQCSTSG